VVVCPGTVVAVGEVVDGGGTVVVVLDVGDGISN
jgi:hypothetical protein